MSSKPDAGFTLIELLVAMALATVLGTLGLVSLQSYARAQDREGTVDEVVSSLRTVAQRSVSEGRTYCVHLDASTDAWSVHRSSCTTGPEVDGGGAARGGAELTALAFPGPACPQPAACVLFLPRGTATPGSLQVTRGSAAPATVGVVGVSSRVSRT